MTTTLLLASAHIAGIAFFSMLTVASLVGGGILLHLAIKAYFESLRSK